MCYKREYPIRSAQTENQGNANRALTALASLVGVGVYTGADVDAGLGRLNVGRRRLEGFAGDDAVDV